MGSHTKELKNVLKTKAKAAKEFRGTGVEKKWKKQDFTEPGRARKTIPSLDVQRPEGALFRGMHMQMQTLSLRSSAPEVKANPR